MNNKSIDVQDVMMKSDDIKILIACHKPAFIPDFPLFFPIQVGSALSEIQLKDMLHDDTGENISRENRNFCELTAIYWAWKNLDAAYYGLFHYRRYLAFDSTLKDDEWGNVYAEKISPKILKRIGMTEDNMCSCIYASDVITVRARKYTFLNSAKEYRTVYKEYDVAPFQHKKDLDTVLQILQEKYPDYVPYAEKYLCSDSAYECNMFIMRKDLFMRYCPWLFDILFEAKKRIDITDYDPEEARIFGYLGERLLGIYLTKLKAEQYKVLELPKLLIKNTELEYNVSAIKPIFQKEVPIILAANNFFAPHLDIVLRSVIANANPHRAYDIIIFYNNITEKNRKTIAHAAYEKCNISIRFLQVKQYFDKSKFYLNQQLSIETYYRLMILELLPDYEKVLYLDCDLIANKDVAELFDIDIGENVLGACRDIDVAGQINLRINDWETYATQELGLSSAFDYVQAGVLIFNLAALRKITSSKEMMKLATSQCWRCHDQDVLNIICRNRVFRLPQKWNVLMNWQEGNRSRMNIMRAAPPELFREYEEARCSPYIVHFAGYQKPWNVQNCDFSEYYWKYAELSPYHHKLLGLRYSVNTPTQQSTTSGFQKALWKLFGSFFPAGGTRRKIFLRTLTVFFPFGTKRREILNSLLSRFRG